MQEQIGKNPTWRLRDGPGRKPEARDQERTQAPTRRLNGKGAAMLKVPVSTSHVTLETARIGMQVLLDTDSVTCPAALVRHQLKGLGNRH